MPYPYDDEVLPGEGGLLGRINTGLNSALGRFGASLLGDYGSGPEPRNVLGSIGKAGLVAGTAQAEALQTNYMRERMLGAQRERQQQQALQQLISSGKIAPPAGMDRDQFAAVFAAAPDAVAKAWATSAFPQKYDPATEVEILKLRADIDRQRAEAEKARIEAGGAGAAQETKLNSAADALKSARGAGGRLVGSSLAPGSATAGFVEPLVKGAAAVEGLFPGMGIQAGAESALGATQADVVDRETLNKSVTTLVNTLTPMAQAGSGGSVLGLTLAERASANINLQWPTIRRILIGNTTQALREAKQLGVDIPGEANLRAELDAMRQEDEEYTRTGGKIDDTAVKEYTPKPGGLEAYTKEEAIKLGLAIPEGTVLKGAGISGSGAVVDQPPPKYGPLESGGDQELPAATVAPAAPAAAPAAPAAPLPSAAWMPSFADVPSFADLFGQAKGAAAAVPGLVGSAVQQAKTVPIPGVNAPVPSMPSLNLDDVVSPQTQGVVKDAVQEGAARTYPVVRQAIAAAREAGDKVAVVGNEVYALSGRKLGPVVNGIVELQSKADLKLVRGLVDKGIRRAKVGTKYFTWRE